MSQQATPQARKNPSRKAPTKPRNAPTVFARLKARGIDYTEINFIVQFERPHDTLFFAQWFRRRTISQVLKQAEEWKALLEKDFILSSNADLKSQVQLFIMRTELMVWRALVEANARVGPWNLRIVFLPTGRDDAGRPVYLHPAREIRATNRRTKKVRRAQLPGGPFELTSEAAAWRRAFDELGLWEALWKGDLSHRLISKRDPQGWPIYTRLIVPRLYEFMISHYESPGHHWARHGGGARRRAELPQELLVDMLEILRMEYPHVFGQTTLPQVKAAVQRHLGRKRQKKPKELSRPIGPKRPT